VPVIQDIAYRFVVFEDVLQETWLIEVVEELLRFGGIEGVVVESPPASSSNRRRIRRRSHQESRQAVLRAR